MVTGLALGLGASDLSPPPPPKAGHRPQRATVEVGLPCDQEGGLEVWGRKSLLGTGGWEGRGDQVGCGVGYGRRDKG